MYRCSGTCAKTTTCDDLFISRSNWMIGCVIDVCSINVHTPKNEVLDVAKP